MMVRHFYCLTIIYKFTYHPTMNIHNMIEIDFSKRHSFPGTTGNSFDNLLHAFILIERIPLPIYVFFLLILSFLPRPTDFYMVTIRWLFSLIDLALLAGLPLSGKSFGPAKPPVLILSVFRTLISLFPLFISLPLQVIGTLLVIYGFWIEPHCIGVTKQTFQSKKISPGKIIRILHIGDLHVERITKREQQLNQLIRNLNPDLILFSGDFLNLSYRKDPIAIEAVRSLIMEWHARYGTFGVTGSPAVDLPEVIPNLIEGLPLVLLDDQIQSLSIDGQEINIIGLTCSHKPFIDGPILKTLLS